jgi:hypothetical protein
MRRRLPLITFVLAALAVSGITTASAAAGPIGFSGADPIDFGNQAVGTQSNSVTVDISNDAGADQDLNIDIGGVTIGGQNPGSFQLSNNNCSGAAVSPGTSCSVDVSFTPVNGTGGYSATLIVTDTADSVSGSTGLTGTGTGAPTADPSPGSLSFGGQGVNTTSDPQTVTLTNNGNVALTIGGVSKSGSDPGSFLLSNNTCTGSVAAGDACTIDVSFNPSTTGGASASLDFADDAGDSPQSVALSGTGTAAAVSVSPDPFDFGDVKVGSPAASHEFTVTNDGSLLLVIPVGGVSVTGAGFSKGADGCSDKIILLGGSCKFTVLFDPGSAGPQSGLASITSNDPASPYGVSLSGNGTVPVAVPSPTLSFATAINDSDTETITLTNSGDADLVVSAAALTGSDMFTKIVTATPCAGSTLHPGDHCTVDIKFSPTSTTAQNGTLTFTDDSGSVPGSKQTVQITGTVLIPGISSDPTSMGFELLPVGRLSNPITAVITNEGQANLHIPSIAIGGLNYKSFRLGQQTCTLAPIPAGDTCTINVRFSPTKLGSRVASLLVRNDAGGSASTLNVALTGTGVRPASVTALRAAAGCTDARLTWRNPDAIGFVRVQVVRNSAHTPRGPFDGVILKHTAGALTDTGLTQFHSYHYALYAVYTSFDHSHLVYSAGSAAALRTGRICTPRNGSLISDLSPPVDWTSFGGARYYAYILQRFGHTILVRYPKHSQTTLPSSWTFNGQSKSIQHGGTYSFYLYTYTRSRPKGFLIGQTVFTER